MEESLVAHVPLYGDFFRCARRRNQEDDLAAVSPARLEHVARGINRVVEGGRLLVALRAVDLRAGRRERLARALLAGSWQRRATAYRPSRRWIGGYYRAMRSEFEALELSKKQVAACRQTRGAPRWIDVGWHACATTRRSPGLPIAPAYLTMWTGKEEQCMRPKKQ